MSTNEMAERKKEKKEKPLNEYVYLPCLGLLSAMKPLSPTAAIRRLRTMQTDSAALLDVDR